MFKPLGFTIVYCLSASYISALTVVPLCYMMYKPKEKESAPLSSPVARLRTPIGYGCAPFCRGKRQ